eukprot:CAMPEP_0176294192 /NCGR_PEP_ID=MMETSP0121_2-20121125/57011_1 /TAXON_ID=160619 /ORGANISM="Kryptoperidinium foliaceum, Strain CCMP 1326" /LENGTH=252 /DNA_ID=CAMNT_0017635205 /DNA_START=305 /DNA_END=1063 /DNA_ORIENTATION=+
MCATAGLSLFFIESGRVNPDHVRVHSVEFFREHATDELAVVNRPAAIRVERLEQLDDSFGHQADPYLVHHRHELRQVQLAVLVFVEKLEEHRHVVRPVAPLPQLDAGPVPEQDEVAVLPHLGEGVADDAQRHRHVEDAEDDQDGDDHGARQGLWGDVAVAHGGHRHDGQPHRMRQGLDVRARLHDVNQRGEEQGEHEEGEEAHGQALRGLLRRVDQQLQRLEAPQRFQCSDHRHEAHEDRADDTALLALDKR